MAWTAKNDWLNTDKPQASALNNLANDIRAWGGNVNAGGYNLSNVGLITQDAWVALPLNNSWVNFGTPFATAGYRKDKQGYVVLRGVVKSGTWTDGTIVATLPTGYRPASQRNFIVSGTGQAAYVDVFTDGTIRIYGATGNGYLSLETIRFDV